MPVRVLGNILTQGEIRVNSVVHIGENGTIEAILPRDSTHVEYDYSGCLVVPGFIDVHVHGGGGADFMDGSVDSVRQVLRTHARFGTTTLVATTLTANHDHIVTALDSIQQVMNSPSDSEARIAGVHLEGPYICAAKRGAQPLAPIRPPDTHEFNQFMDRFGNIVKLITMAPEIAPDGGLEFIINARARGTVVSIGHTNCTYTQASKAVEFGVTHATHLFNAMPSLNHREPGAVGVCLESDDVYVELIADGVHVHPAVIKLVTRAKGVDKVILITDAISGASMPDGSYSLGGQDVIVADGTAQFHDGTLAGSVLTMNRAFSNIQSFGNVSQSDASKMASANAARQLGIDSWTGSLSVGKRADLAILDPKTHDVFATMREGIWIHRV